MGKFYQTFIEEFTSILQISQKIAKEGILPNYFYKAIMTHTKVR